MPIFEVVVLEKPEPEAAKEGALEHLVLGPVPIIARDERTAAVAAALEHHAAIAGLNRARMEILVRPFA